MGALREEGSVRTIKTGPKVGRPKGPQTFVVNDGEARMMGGLTGFRDVIALRCDPPMPELRKGDRLLMRVPSEHLMGEGVVLEARIISGRNSRFSAVAVQMIGSPLARPRNKQSGGASGE